MMDILWKIAERIQNYEKFPLLIAVDGRCAAGKTTLAAALRERTGCQVIHMDDFFLRPGQRTEQRLQEPGGNVDYERFLEEVMLPLSRGEGFSYRAFDCRKMELADAVRVEPRAVTVVEGSYSCHPALWDYYSLHVFLDIDKEEQFRRICLRNGNQAAARFRELWIPLEEKYFAAYRIRERCELTSP
ncbi:MAG: hypothetical protein HFH88_04915 [Lachnospiraceae bacterium]|nr:hypothetical protein [Lachnospiraceae bacterium]